jgi:hypothetical protein
MKITSHTAAPYQFGKNARVEVHPVTSGALAATRAAGLALALFFAPPMSNAIDAITTAMTSLAPPGIGNLSFISPAGAQPAALTKSQSDALNAYNNAVNDFKSILSQRRAQIDSKQQPPDLPGLQGSHRRASVQNRKTQQIWHSSGVLQCRR